MKFMKLGSKPDVFRTDEAEKNTRYVDMELASDITIIVGDMKFQLHKFPLLSKSALLQSLAITTKPKDDDYEVHTLDNFPGGSTTFELCAKFCYGMVVTLNAHNVVKARCASEFLGMHETIEKGNLVYKIDAFFNSCILRSWKESIIVLQSTKSMLPLAEDLKLVSRCVASISSMASIHTSKVDWCYTYNRKKPIQGTENNLDFHQRVVVPKDWWVEDLSELEITPFENVIEGIKNKGLVCDETIGDAIKSYAYKNLPVPTKGVNHFKCTNVPRIRSMVESIVRLLPREKGSVSCSFLLKLLKVSLLVDSDENIKSTLIEKIGRQLDEAIVTDILIEVDQVGEGKTTYDVEIVERIIQEFLNQDQNSEIETEVYPDEMVKSNGISSKVSWLLVVKLIDAYLAEIAKDPNLTIQRFLAIAEMISTESRQAHDALYRAIDMYLKEHSGMSKSEKKSLCKIIDCKKLSTEACTHAVQNERLPMRMIIQILFHEQARATMASSGSSTPDLPLPTKLLNLNNGSTRSAPPEPEDWDALGGSGTGSEEDGTGESKVRFEKAVLGKMKGLLIRAKKKNKLRKMWSIKSFQGEIGGNGNGNGEFSKRASFSSSSSSHFHEEGRSTPSRVQSRISIS